MAQKNVAVFISGKGSNLEAILKKRELSYLDCNIPFVVSSRKDAKGLQIAKDHHIQTYVVNHRCFSSRHLYEEKLLELTKKHSIDIIVLAGFMKILSSHFMHHFTGPILNIHPALLPAFPGLNAQKRALEYGVKFAGCTVHLVTDNVDAGPIFAQEIIPVFNDDSEESLSLRILEREHILLPEVLKIVIDGNYEIMGRRVLIYDDNN
ncbi:MAG: phosphoribosylglycinamide formyltransferase [Caldisericia bacterium]|nr:phosphoribosylglycinamide formyltransferase [Caldisericia bacterium]MDD4614372.1 phosphoribosylglycinamide formyltransferase [Caldisericia bacterium]